MSFNVYISEVSKKDTNTIHWIHALSTLLKYFPNYDYGEDSFALVLKSKTVIELGAVYHDECLMRMYDTLRTQFGVPLLTKGTEAYESYYCCDNYHNEVLLKPNALFFKYMRNSFARFVVNDFSELRSKIDGGIAFGEMCLRLDEFDSMLALFDKELDKGNWRALENLLRTSQEAECIHDLRKLYDADLKHNDLMLYGI